MENIIFAENNINMNIKDNNKSDHTNIVELIQLRLESMGMSQAQFAECVSATPAQMSIFLREKGSLSIDSLNKSFDLIGIHLSIYRKRNDLAKNVASYLLSKNVTSIDNWSKQDLVRFTGQDTISHFFDVDTKEELIELERSGIIDVESTFPYFKALVSYYMLLNGKKPTASKAKQALSSLFNNSLNSIMNDVRGVFHGALSGLTDTVEKISKAVEEKSIFSDSDSMTGKQVGASSLFSRVNPNSLFAKALDFLKDDSKKSV